MGYRVDYEPVNRAFRGRAKYTLRFSLMTAFFFALFVLVVCAFWSDGKEAMLSFLLPGATHNTLSALEALAEALRVGEPFSAAFETFCRDILLEAGVV